MIFTLRQLQEKCREQSKPLCIAFVDLTKAFDTVSRPSLYKILKHIGCPPKLLQLIVSFHEGMKASIQFDGSTSDSFEVKSGVKQGCVLVPTLFGIFFAVLLYHAFGDADGDVFIRIRSDG
uniref:Reverse transcriptase domain-containing protein n=1 Tax=Arion vulgaris TaxID=1028688 RepID=A0A0B7BRI9_9EUPU